ncbi:RGD1564752 (predicted), isoform CRA_b [Rattus norvegicus]|uniref:RGD1564752 (Predicted), isoform CRA_b n=1 Tax=Rattus norvegicus TaxID=10116 RepID=A6J3R9_RAT|nr:RGD1564752 (predicted), isoform CRA_b [Rattus norvegicus]
MATSLILDAARSFPPPAIVLSPDNGRQPQKLRSPKATWREEDCPWQRLLPCHLDLPASPRRVEIEGASRSSKGRHHYTQHCRSLKLNTDLTDC